MKSKTKLLTAFLLFTVIAFFPATGSAIILQEETVAIQDTFIYELEPDDVHGSQANVRAGRVPFSVFPFPTVLLENEAFFKFNLSFDIPLANVTKVLLVLPITGSLRSTSPLKQMIFDIWEINDVFDEGTTWNNQPVTWDSQLKNIIIENDAEVPTQFEVDITTLVTGTYNINDTIFSIGVRRVDTYDTQGYIDFGSSESTSKPKIVLSYDDGIARPWWILLWEFLISPFVLIWSIIAGLFGFAVIRNKRVVKKIKNLNL